MRFRPKCAPRAAVYITEKASLHHGADERGFLHRFGADADGAAQVQGIVAGCAELRQAVYFSPQGYYKDMLYDLTLLENSATAQPLWHGGAEAVRRKEAVCVE